jgi:hypothetical protein
MEVKVSVSLLCSNTVWMKVEARCSNEILHYNPEDQH